MLLREKLHTHLHQNLVFGGMRTEGASRPTGKVFDLDIRLPVVTTPSFAGIGYVARDDEDEGYSLQLSGKLNKGFVYFADI